MLRPAGTPAAGRRPMIEREIKETTEAVRARRRHQGGRGVGVRGRLHDPPTATIINTLSTAGRDRAGRRIAALGAFRHGWWVTTALSARLHPPSHDAAEGG